MSGTAAAKIFGLFSYLFLAGAFVVYFVLKDTTIVLAVLILAGVFRMLMERSERVAAEKENTKLKEDLRRLTRILEELKKDNTGK